MGDNRRPSLRRALSTSGPTMLNTLNATPPRSQRLSHLFTKPSETPPRVERPSSPSDGSKRRIIPVPSPMTRVNSASGGSMSRKQLSMKSHPSQSRYSNKSVRDDHPKGDEPYAREDADVEIEELRSRLSETTPDHTRHGSVTRHASLTLKKVKSEWVTTPKASPPVSPHTLAHSPSKLRLGNWVSSSGLLRPNAHMSMQLRAFCWLGTLCIHSLCATIYSWLAAVHAKLPRTKLGVLLPAYAPELFNLAHYATVVCVIASVLAAIHATVALRMVRQSITCRQLMYYAPNYFNAARNNHIMPFSASMKALTGLKPSQNAPTGQQIIASLFSKSWWVLQELLWARRDLLVLNYTPPSERMYRVTLVVQTALHIFEASKMSRHVGTSSWLHQGYLTAIVLNASVPLLLTLLRNSQHIQWHTHRISSLLCSLALDVFGVLVVRVVLILAYCTQYDASAESFPAARLLCDRWLVPMLLEVRFVLAMDTMTTLLRLGLGLHLLSSLNALQSLLESVTSSRPPIPSTERSISGSPTKRQAPATLIRVKPGNRRTVFMELLLCLGCVVPLAAYASARADATYPSTTACPLAIRPWFATSPFCPLVEMNCAVDASLSSGGGADDLQTVLSRVDPLAVRHLVIRSCPSVRVSRALHTLPGLVVLKIKSSTVESWASDAAFSAQTQPNLRLFVAVQVPFTALPDGLLGSDLPPTLTEIHLCSTNLTTLPSDLHTRWAHVTTLVLELSLLDEVPATVLQMTSLRELSLSGNNVSTVPAELLRLPVMETLYLNGNPVGGLPLDVAPADSLTLLAMDSTLLTAVPQWATGKGDLLLMLGGTPFCEQADAATLAEIAALGISCTPLADESMTMLPLLLAE